MRTKTLNIALVVVLAVMFGMLLVLIQKPWQLSGSVIQGNEYNATSTRNYEGTVLTNLTRLKNAGDNCVAGSLAQVTITGANTGIIRFWDATTTDSTQRAAVYASSTLLIATIPASAAAGTYTFDATFDCGLIYELQGGLAPTSTIMWR